MDHVRPLQAVLEEKERRRQLLSPGGGS